ncbi:major facilitator superfamily transporter [Thozetella sp. PMI_491]|nr:major facilitator superfamily transporter [Thozetella sp. PMI_491]
MKKDEAPAGPALAEKGDPPILVEERSPVAPSTDEVLAELGLERRSDRLLYWRADSPDHPRNWSAARKTFDTTVIILFEFYTTVISTTGAAVASRAGPSYGLDRRQALIAFTFMYQLGQALGGVVVPPFSEKVGRRLPYLISCATFSLFCLLIAVVPTASTAYVGRLVTGFASAVPSVVIAGSIEDVFNTRRRVWVVVLWNAGTTAGLCFGPVYAAYISEAFGWPWVFYSAASGTAAILLALLAIRESRPSLLLGRRVERARAETAIAELAWYNPDASPDLAALLDVVVVRPLILLGTEPLVILVAIVSAVSWSIIYLFTEALTGIYMSMGFTAEQASLPFLAVAAGVLFTFLPRFWDMRVVRARAQKNEPVEPEDKIAGFAFAAPALALGLIWFSLTLPPLVQGLSWVVPTLALIPVGFAVNEIAYTLSGYLADACKYSRGSSSYRNPLDLLYSASAFAGLAFVRALLSGLMPLIAHEMYTSLNANVAGSILAGLSALFCLAPWVFFRWSKPLRERSPFAQHSSSVHQQTRIEAE